MKDDGEKVELTFGDVRRAADSCSDAKRVLEKLVPGAFAPKEEWEDVTLRLSARPGVNLGCSTVFALAGNHGETGNDYPFMVIVNSESSGAHRAKIENGRAYYRKA